MFLLNLREFSVDLINYLIELCVFLRKLDFHCSVKRSERQREYFVNKNLWTEPKMHQKDVLFVYYLFANSKICKYSKATIRRNRTPKLSRLLIKICSRLTGIKGLYEENKFFFIIPAISRDADNSPLKPIARIHSLQRARVCWLGMHLFFKLAKIIEK